MLRKLRIGIAVTMLILITFYFLDFAQWMPAEFHGLAHIQFIPALLSGSIGIFAALLVITLLFGRIYCSVICPTGIFQDVISRVAASTRKKRKRFKYTPARNALRWSVVGIVILSFVLGFSLILSLLEPYSAYGRLVSNVFTPIYATGNNLLEGLFSRFDNYTFYRIDVSIVSLASFFIALGSFLIIGFLAWRYGRSYCNSICPVGTLLGFVSKYALFKVRINTDQCNGCGVCASKCKASCINEKEHIIDYSRCVDCFDCLENCKQHAIQLAGPTKKKSEARITKTQITPQPALSDAPVSLQEDSSPTNPARRQFLGTLLATAVVIPASFAQKKSEELLGEKPHGRQTPLSPPGSKSTAHLQKHCTACHLCISKCPSNVLKPALMEYGLGGVMQPVMNFDKGFCNFDCTACSEICPNGALSPLTVEEKHLTQVGVVVFNREDCIVYKDETSCGACSEHCPTQAVTMIPYKEGLTIPSTNPEICVGCGGCEYVCPARPFRAIHVEGHAVHQPAKPFERSEKHNIQVDDFGF